MMTTLPDPGSNPCPSLLDRFLPKACHRPSRTFPGNPSIDHDAIVFDSIYQSITLWQEA